jgi:hypothetical protein
MPPKKQLVCELIVNISLSLYISPKRMLGALFYSRNL